MVSKQSTFHIAKHRTMQPVCSKDIKQKCKILPNRYKMLEECFKLIKLKNNFFKKSNNWFSILKNQLYHRKYFRTAMVFAFGQL